MKSWFAIGREEGQHRRYLRRQFPVDSSKHGHIHSGDHYSPALAGSLPFYVPKSIFAV